MNKKLIPLLLCISLAACGGDVKTASPVPVTITPGAIAPASGGNLNPPKSLAGTGTGTGAATGTGGGSGTVAVTPAGSSNTGSTGTLPPASGAGVTNPASGSTSSTSAPVVAAAISPLAACSAVENGQSPTGSNPTPVVIPTLQQWHGGAGQLKLTTTSRIVVDSALLMSVANTFAADLQTLTGYHLPVASNGILNPGDIGLSLTPCTSLANQTGKEAYSASITGSAIIRGNNAAGVFYGTQTLLQMLKADVHRQSISQGMIVDWPVIAQRGQMLDAGRKFFPLNYLEQQIRLMAWMKLNTFHLHLSDWEGFRVQSILYPSLASAQSYTQAQIKQLVQYSDQYYVTIIPEFDVPSHSTVISSAFPADMFTCPSMSTPAIWPGTAGSWTGSNTPGWTLDITSSATRTLLSNLFGELIPLFDGPYFHIGTDEVPYPANQAGCPAWVAYQTSKGYPYTGDVLVDFINAMDTVVKNNGKTMEIWQWWNYQSTTSIQPNTDIVVDDWLSASPTQFSNAGYKTVGTDEDLLYITPGFMTSANPTGGLMNSSNIYATYAFTTGANILGYKISRWSDDAETEPVSYLDVFAVAPRQVIADRTWGGPMQTSYTVFANNAIAVGGPPYGSQQIVLEQQSPLCLDIVNGFAAAALCNSASTTQQWNFNASGQIQSAAISATGAAQCLAESSSTTLNAINGSTAGPWAQVSTCSSTATNQTFRYSNENLIAQDGTCLDIAGYSSGNGIKSDQIPIDLWQCGVAQQNQIWLAPKNP